MAKSGKIEEDIETPKVFADIGNDKEEIVVTDKSIISPNCYWVTCGIGAGFCMGTGAFIYASKYAKYGLVGTGVLGPGIFVVSIVLRIIL